MLHFFSVLQSFTSFACLLEFSGIWYSLGEREEKTIWLHILSLPILPFSIFIFSSSGINSNIPFIGGGGDH
jgi:hypothetical protein